MVKSILDGYLPTAKDCCRCLSLKDGTILIAVLGFVSGVYYVWFFAFTREILKQFNLTEISADILLHIQGVIGVIICGAHAMLLVAAITYQEVVILLYLWIIIAYLAIEVPLMVYLSVIVVFSGKADHDAIWLIVPSLVSILLFIFIYMPVVNGFRRNIHTVVVIV